MEPNEQEPKQKIYEILDPTQEMEALQQELRELRDSVSKHEENTQSYLEQIKRLQADFENWRRRVEGEKSFLIENASSFFIEKLLPVLDNFERALSAPAKVKGESTFKEGIHLIFRQFLDLLKEEGVTPIEALGATFDPKLHEAYSYEERSEGEDQQIIEEARKGYMYKDRVLRPALVKVAKLSTPVSARSTDGELKEESHQNGSK